MALELKYNLLIDVDADSFYVEDNTLQYSASNLGGWGAPNDDIADIALAVFAERIEDSGNTVVNVVSTQFVTGLAVFDHQFELELLSDGHYKVGMFAIWVTTDGITTLGGHTIVTGDVVYYNGQVQKYNGPGFDVVTDYSTLYDEVTVAQVVNEFLLTPKIQNVYNQLYLAYNQNVTEGCTSASDLQDEIDNILRLNMEIQGAQIAFYSGSPVEARDILERITNEYST